MHCNTEEECSHLASTISPVEATLLEWAINLMADVVKNKSYNKMNARNIAMVFAPNMTKVTGKHIFFSLPALLFRICSLTTEY